MPRVGIYSGTFDPIHDGHIAFAELALNKCKLDRVMFMTEPQPRRKQGVKALEHRQNMVDIAIKDYNSFGHIHLDHTQFNVEKTLPVLQSRFSGSDLYFLIGDDVLDSLVYWPHLYVLVESCKFVIGVRTRKSKDITHTIQLLAETIGSPIEFSLLYVDAPDVSSSKIRARVKKGQKPKHVTPEVYAYIKDSGLYAADEQVS